jgi:hypothetical protein
VHCSVCGTVCGDTSTSFDQGPARCGPDSPGHPPHVRTEESYDGIVARVLRGPIQKTLDRGLDDGLRYLKAEVERSTTH